MRRSETEYLRDILSYARKIQHHVKGMTREQFESNELVAAGIVYYLQVIGEAASHVSDEYKAVQNAVPWGKISRMRNRLVHNYFEVNYEVVWAAATTEMQPLIDVLRNLVSDD
jgi:uncharacterized protein with HEPN domain